MDNLEFDSEYLPLDVAVQLMSHGIDMNEHDGYTVFDPYFND
jgi:hypothetical protein